MAGGEGPGTALQQKAKGAVLVAVPWAAIPRELRVPVLPMPFFVGRARTIEPARRPWPSDGDKHQKARGPGVGAISFAVSRCHSAVLL